MGNYTSLCSSTVTPSSKASKVIFLDGQVHQFHRPVKVAELMLESPNSFLVNTKSLNVGKRLLALSADEDLKFDNVYMLFPMRRRLKSVVTDDDMARLFMVANPTAIKRANNKVRVLPAESSHETESSRFNFEEVGGLELKYRLSMSRSRKPLLDTITEEPVHTR